MGKRWRIAALAGFFALVTACSTGGDGGNGVASVSDKNTAEQKKDKPKGSPEEQARAYARCMREHGVDVPDPKPGEGGIAVGGGEADQGTFEKADAACKHLLPGGGEMEKPSPEQLDEMRKQAKCLREHGLDVPDPTADKPYIEMKTDESNNDKVNKAMAECMGDLAALPAEGDK